MRKICVVCIHSLKPEYLKYMPYLNSLTKKYSHGNLTFKDGFMSSVLTFLNGKNKILSFFYYDQKERYLRWVRNFEFLEVFGFFGRLFLNILINLKAILDKKHLMITYNIPIKDRFEEVGNR